MATSPAPRPAASHRPVTALVSLLAALAVTAVLATPVGAQPAVGAVVDEITDTGSYVEIPVDDDLRAAIGEATEENIAVVLTDEAIPASDIEPYSRDVLAGLEDQQSPYRVVLVSSTASVGAVSNTVGGLDTALRSDGPAFQAFAIGDNADGIRRFTAAVTGSDTPASDGAGADDGGRGGGFGWVGLIVVIAVVGLGAGGWWLVRDRKARREADARNEAHRDEIGEQVRNNADKVIALGDRVMAKGDPELIDLYASASETYRDVSHRLESARTGEALEQLDRRMDEAQWRLEVIEARLAGRTPPPPPTSDTGDGDEARAAGPPPPTGATGGSDDGRAVGRGDDDPVLGRDESLFGTVLPPAPPSRVPGIGRRRRGRHGGRR